MATGLRLQRFFTQELWTANLDGAPPAQRALFQVLRLVVAVAYEFRLSLLDARAAGLVYTTLLSLVPFLAVTFSVLKGFGAHHQIEALLTQALEPLGPNGVEITRLVIGFIDNLKLGVLGALGVAGLFYTTYSLIEKIERALNAIWRVRRGRPLARKFTDYLSVILVGPVLVFTAVGLLASVRSHAIVERVAAIQPFGTVLVWTAELMPFFLLCGVFTFVYKVVPYCHVAPRSAFIGGMTAAVLWGLTGEAFAAFVATSGKYSAIYSGFAVLVLFLIWLYASWMIILVGAQVSFFIQHPAAYQARFPWQQDTPARRERLVLEILSTLGRRHLRGDGPLCLTELANELGVPSPVVEERITELVDHGLLARTAEPEGVGLFKPPELIAVNEVLELVHGGPATAPGYLQKPGDPIDNLIQRRDIAAAQSLDGMTLHSLIVAQEKAAARPEVGVNV